ncbi:MAG: YCF48-related protein [Phycisphaerales bacterium]|nr:YCF48-related protein [Phycisphaerales bacterium]
MKKYILGGFICLILFGCRKTIESNSNYDNNIASNIQVPKNVLVGGKNAFVFNINGGAISSSKTNFAGSNSANISANIIALVNVPVTYNGGMYSANEPITLMPINGTVTFYYAPSVSDNNTKQTIDFTFKNSASNITQTISANVSIQSGFVINLFSNNRTITTNDTGAFTIQIFSDGSTTRTYNYLVSNGDSIFDYSKSQLYYNSLIDTLAQNISVALLQSNVGLITKIPSLNRIVTVTINDPINNITRVDTLNFVVNKSLINGFVVSGTVATKTINVGDTGQIYLRIQSDGQLNRQYIFYPNDNDTIIYNNRMYNKGQAFVLFSSATVDTTIMLGFVTQVPNSNRVVNLVVKDLSNATQMASVSFNVGQPISNSNGVAVGDTDYGGSTYSYTTDGGKTWSLAQRIPGFDSISIRSVAFSSATNGVAVGNNNYSTTTDGGKTWSNAQTITGMSGIYSVAFSSATNGVAVGYNGNYSTTTDGGKTWSNAQTITGMLGINSVAFSSATKGVAVGYNNGGAYSYTTDGGKTWSNAQKISGMGGINSVAFSSDTNGVAVGVGINGGVYSTTTDGGKTWSNAQTISGMDIINSVAFSSATKGVAVGNSGYSTTTDGGQTWAPAQQIQGLGAVNSVAFSSATNGVAAGDNSGYSTTTDGGQTWSNAQIISGMRTIKSVAFGK